MQNLINIILFAHLVQHANDGAALAVGDGVEDLIDFRRVIDGHLWHFN